MLSKRGPRAPSSTRSEVATCRTLDGSGDLGDRSPPDYEALCFFDAMRCCDVVVDKSANLLGDLLQRIQELPRHGVLGSDGHSNRCSNNQHCRDGPRSAASKGMPCRNGIRWSGPYRRTHLGDMPLLRHFVNLGAVGGRESFQCVLVGHHTRPPSVDSSSARRRRSARRDAAYTATRFPPMTSAISLPSIPTTCRSTRTVR